VGVLQLQEDDGKLREDVLVLLPASIATSDGGRRHATTVARAKVATQFGSKIRTIPETEFLARLRQKPYPGTVRLVGLDRVTARVTGLRHFPYPGAIRLAGLNSGKAKTLTQAGFSPIPQPELG
jgi:hypothetical protein